MCSHFFEIFLVQLVRLVTWQQAAVTILLFVTRSRLLIVVTSTINRGLKIPGVWWPERVPPGLIHRRALRRFATRAFLGGAILRSASNFLSLRIRTSYRVPYAWSGKLSRTASERVQRLSALARHGLRSTLYALPLQEDMKPL